MTEKSPKVWRFAELDVFRGIAAFAVVLFHYSFQYTNLIEPVRSRWFSFDYGYLGVELFFIISGFVIFMTLERCKNGRDFIVSRFSRLYPVYWAAILVSLSAALLLPLNGFHLDLDVILINFTMLQSYLYLPNVDGAYWSLNVELSFYFCMFVVFKLNLLKRIETVLISWLTLSCLLSIAGKYDFYIPYSIYNLLIFKYIPLFSAGIVFYRIWKAQNLSILHCIILCLCLATLILKNGIGVQTYMVICFFSVFLLSIFSKLKWITIRPLVFLGNISYALYLLHQMIGYRIIYHLTQQGMDFNYAMIIAIVTVIALATLLTKIVERPAMKIIKTVWRNKQKVTKPFPT